MSKSAHFIEILLSSQVIKLLKYTIIEDTNYGIDLWKSDFRMWYSPSMSKEVIQ